jgi:hypothetical protein
MNHDHARRVLDFQELRTHVPLTAVLERYGVLGDLKKMGAQLYGACPLHGGSNKRQFVVNPSTSEWKCFSPEHGEPSGGGVLEYVAQAEKADIRHAAQLIASWFATPSGSNLKQPAQRRRSVMSENAPTHRVYSAKRREGAEKDDLTLIGSGWVFETKDKKRSGMNIVLSAMPISDRIVIFERDPEWEAEQQAKREAGNGNGKSFAKKK